MTTLIDASIESRETIAGGVWHLPQIHKLKFSVEPTSAISTTYVWKKDADVYLGEAGRGRLSTGGLEYSHGFKPHPAGVYSELVEEATLPIFTENGEGRGGAEREINMRLKRSTARVMHKAGELRKSPTPAEAKLWAALRRNQLDGIRFRRQHAIGQYIVDFCSPRNHLVIELDGGGHPELKAYDQHRTEYLESQGYRVLRFWNDEVIRDVDAVLRAIHDSLTTAQPPAGTSRAPRNRNKIQPS